MSNIIKFYPNDAAKDPDVVLEMAKGEYSDLVIIGWDKDEESYLDVRSTLGMTQQEIIWMIEKFKHKMLNGDYSE